MHKFALQLPLRALSDQSAQMPSTSTSSELIKVHGYLMGGPDLWRALGFRSATAFRRAVQIGAIQVRLFTLPKRRGWFALAKDVGTWLDALAEPGAASPPSTAI
jgi:hypothetical protein